MIAASSLQLATDWPGFESSSPIKRVLTAADAGFALAFTAEAALKIVVYGLISSRDTARPAYLQSGWNVLDFHIVLISLASLATLLFSGIRSTQHFSFLRALRTLRALRPLRLISRMPGLRMIVGTLLTAIPAVSQYLAVAAIFVVIFAIAAVQIFGGRLGYCLDPLHSVNDSRIAASDASGLSDYSKCLALPPYNISRHNSIGVALTALPHAEYARFYSFPQVRAHRALHT